MQNKLFYHLLIAGLVTLGVVSVQAQEADDSLFEDNTALSTDVETPSVGMEVSTDVAPAAEPETPAENELPDIVPDLTGRQSVGFPSRGSLDDLELARLPAVDYTNITGPATMAESVSAKDLPSERIIGRLTPEVFKEMADLERDKTFLQLQIQKETMKNQLEKLKATYRQDRLAEIEKRENVIRTRIKWWQEQEKLRQELEAQRAEAERAEAEASLSSPQSQPDDEPVNDQVNEAPSEVVEAQEEVAPIEKLAKAYALVAVHGTRNDLTAKIKNIESSKIVIVKVGDTLTDGTYISEISSKGVHLLRDGEEFILRFDEVN